MTATLFRTPAPSPPPGQAVPPAIENTKQSQEFDNSLLSLTLTSDMKQPIDNSDDPPMTGFSHLDNSFYSTPKHVNTPTQWETTPTVGHVPSEATPTSSKAHSEVAPTSNTAHTEATSSLGNTCSEVTPAPGHTQSEAMVTAHSETTPPTGQSREAALGRPPPLALLSPANSKFCVIDDVMTVIPDTDTNSY